ncbi:FAD/NAD(P)-binding domain-containing protein [Aspergillus caelatus]|uniref:FAD/NAD(P)-binding domain-containing protein n=1 Tax=Aspergillus caelatus TaxID=61420 RepID=A0A5N6ZRK6_9EURO|nr:FAD/NAD(P)-binding domain-containing protein [Aspergillus caelatus]KAE8360267.1 FAD/NAD(P)-binding domain-containing protein [Aspergillus caelatus]
MTHSTDYDALVIGAGPAGLAAATALGRACRQVAVFDSQEYRNERVEEMHNVVLHDGQKPELYRAAAIKAISSKYSTVTFIDTVIKTATVTATAVSDMHKFQVTSTNDGHFRGKKLILATGSKDYFPDIPGYAELWGKGIVHCLFCDGFEKKDTPAGALGLESLQDLASVLMAHHMSNGPLTIFLNGESVTRDEDQKALRVAKARGCKIDQREIRRFSRDSASGYILIEFTDGSQCQIGILLHHPETVNRASSLISGLNLELVQDGGHIQVKNAVGETSARGCFAAGDTATASKIVSVALVGGTMAGIGAARQLAMDEGLCAAYQAEGASATL